MKLSNIHSLQFSVLTAVIDGSHLTKEEKDITSLITSRVDSEGFCEDLMLFSLEEFVSLNEMTDC